MRGTRNAVSLNKAPWVRIPPPPQKTLWISELYHYNFLMFEFFVFACVTAVTPGPNNSMLMASGIKFGKKASDNIKEMAKIDLKRKILGDQP